MMQSMIWDRLRSLVKVVTYFGNMLNVLKTGPLIGLLVGMLDAPMLSQMRLYHEIIPERKGENMLYFEC